MKIALILFITLLFFSCKKEVQASEIKTDTIVEIGVEKQTVSDNSQNSLDWAGTYKGVTPCADCDGIETEITLNNDLNYIIRTKYLGKGDGKIFQEAGNFVWNKTGGIVDLKGLKGRPSQYKVGENRLIQLDMDGKIISGLLEEKYVLIKK